MSRSHSVQKVVPILAIRLAPRLRRIRPSPTVSMTARATRLREQGRDVIALSVGEPDFDTPAHIKAAARDALARGDTKYTAVDGTRRLKDAVVEKLKRDNGLDYHPDQVLISSGAKQSCYNACLALLDAGDEVIIPAPYWVSYPDMVLLADAEPVIVATTLEQRLSDDASCSSRPRSRRERGCVILNSPCNPTGAVYSRAELGALGAVLREHPGDRRAQRRHLRAHLLGRYAVCELRRRLPGPLRAHAHGERRVEVLRDDRLANRLRRGTDGADQGDDEHPEPKHDKRMQYLASGRVRGADRRSVGGRQDVRRLQGASRARAAPAARNPWLRMPACARRVLHVPEDRGSDARERLRRATSRSASNCSRLPTSRSCPALPSAHRDTCGCRSRLPRRRSTMRCSASSDSCATDRRLRTAF